MDGEQSIDWAGLYVEHVTDLAAFARSWGPAETGTSVPATPAWTARDVLAHLAGGPSDHAAGRTEGAPGPAWTAHHVAERQAVPVEDLVVELLGNVDHVVGEMITAESHAVAWDVAVHHADLHEALGRHRLDEHLWAPVLLTVAPMTLGSFPARVTTTVAGRAHSWGAGGPPVEVAAYDLFRAVFSRSPRADLRAWAGDGPTDAELDAVGIFGPSGT